MKYKLATTLLVVAALVVATFSVTTTTPTALAAKPTTTTSPGPTSTFIVDSCPEDPDHLKKPPCDGDNVILRWDEQLLSTIRAYAKETGPTIAARALGVLHTATYDAWAAYDPIARVTLQDGPAQQEATSNTDPNKAKAISFAAYRVLNNLFPPGSFPSKNAYKIPDVLMTTPPADGGLGYDPNEVDNNTPGVVDTPAEVGNAAASAVLSDRSTDGSADTIVYDSVNKWNELNDRWRWQPLCVLTQAGVDAKQPPVRKPTLSCPDPAGYYTLQTPLTPQWGKVRPFSVAPSRYEVLGPPRNTDGTCCKETDILTAVKETSSLSDTAKAKVEYWADGPNTEFPPGHAAVFAQALSRKKGNSLDTDAKLFFLIGNAMLDASIAAWYQKFFGTWPNTTNKYDFVRPITAIRKYYEGQTIPGGWKGPGKGFAGPEGVPADEWIPYQAVTVVTPAFPEYVSGHSTFTSAGATMLAQFNGSDTFGASVIFGKGKSKFDPGTPTADVPITWATFSEAANDAGMSRRWGGIHFYTGDTHGRALGRQVAMNVWGKGQNYIKGYTGK
jgi:hypothetical protein